MRTIALAMAAVACASQSSVKLAPAAHTEEPGAVTEAEPSEDDESANPDDTAGLDDTPNGPTTADILFVMDNTASMAYESQYAVAKRANTFLLTLLDRQVDFHIAVTTTDNGADPSVADPANGAFLGPVRTADDYDQLEDQLRAGYDGGSIEAGLETGLTALTETGRLGSQIDEFRRDGATLSVVFVTDEEDSSSAPGNEYLRRYLGLSGAGPRSNVRLYALITQDPEDCGGDGGRTLGTRLADAATQSGGHADNLLGEAEATLERLATAIADAPAPVGTCSIASDCPVDHYCGAGTCLPGCAADTDCLSGESCEAGSCQPGACRTTPLDCGLGEMCDETTGTCSDGGGCEPCAGAGAECGNGECANFGDDAAPDWYCLMDCATAYDAEACPRGFDCRDLSGHLYCYAECPVLAPILAR